MKNLIILASGSGTNAENLALHFSKSNEVKIKFIGTNNENAGVINRANKLNIPTILFSKGFFNSQNFVDFLKDNSIDYIILAGFLLLVPENLINAYPNKIINIHPSLLPKYGGKGMYGPKVHQSVIENKETESGITIHFVNEEFDKGKIIFQAKCQLSESDTADDVAQKVHELEYLHFPKIIEGIVIN